MISFHSPSLSIKVASTSPTQGVSIEHFCIVLKYLLLPSLTRVVVNVQTYSFTRVGKREELSENKRAEHEVQSMRQETSNGSRWTMRLLQVRCPALKDNRNKIEPDFPPKLSKNLPFLVPGHEFSLQLHNFTAVSSFGISV